MQVGYFPSLALLQSPLLYSSNARREISMLLTIPKQLVLFVAVTCRRKGSKQSTSGTPSHLPKGKSTQEISRLLQARC